MSAQTNSSQKNKGEQVNKKISENLFSSSLIDDGFLNLSEFLDFDLDFSFEGL